MSEVLGADWSFAHIDAKLLVAAGYKYAFRYLAPQPNPKVITKPEYEYDKASGLTVVLNFEQSATQMLGGAAQGEHDALIVRSERIGIGAPLDEQTIYSFDADDRAWPGWQQKLEDYMRAAERVSGHAEGIYGSIRVIEYLKGNNPARATWQTEAWSGNVVSPLADFYQRIGHTVFVPGVNNNDYDEDVVIHRVPRLGGQVQQSIYPNPVIVSLTEFEHPKLGHCAAAVTVDGAVFCDPPGAYLGGGNQGASAYKDFAATGRKAAVIRRPNPDEVAKGWHDGYVIVDTAGETYYFG